MQNRGISQAVIRRLPRYYRYLGELIEQGVEPVSYTHLMWEEYELTYNRALELRNENLTDVAKMKKRIQELKGEMCIRDRSGQS